MKNFSKIGIIFTILLALVLVGQVYIIYMAVNPVDVFTARRERRLVESAAKQAKVNIAEFQSMAELGKTPGFEDIAKLKAASQYNIPAYKNAIKGDRAIAFASKMVVYRPQTDKLIYDGSTPAQLQAKDQQEQLTIIVDRVKEKGYISKDSSESPQVAVVTKADQLKGNAFYKGVVNDDLVLSFNTEGVIILYSMKDQVVLNAARTTLTTFDPAEPTPEKKPTETLTPANKPTEKPSPTPQR